MKTRIRRWVETDTGHRVPNHKSKCRHMHGHRYRWEVELDGEVVTQSGVSEEGMLMDFSDVSDILQKHISIAAKRVNAFLNARPAAIIEADHRRSILHRQL